MEELQSTELLDREILEDARKKALRILKLSEDTIDSQNAMREQKLTEEIKKLEEKYNLQKKTEAERVMARLPIDKLRIKIEKIEGMLHSAADNWFKSLSREQILKLLCDELVIRNEQGAISGEADARVWGLERREAEDLLKKANWACNISEVHSTNSFPAVIIDTKDARITASIEKTVDFLLEEKRAELVEALIGRDFLGDE